MLPFTRCFDYSKQYFLTFMSLYLKVEFSTCHMEYLCKKMGVYKIPTYHLKSMCILSDFFFKMDILLCHFSSIRIGTVFGCGVQYLYLLNSSMIKAWYSWASWLVRPYFPIYSKLERNPRVGAIIRLSRYLSTVYIRSRHSLTPHNC